MVRLEDKDGEWARTNAWKNHVHACVRACGVRSRRFIDPRFCSCTERWACRRLVRRAGDGHWPIGTRVRVGNWNLLHGRARLGNRSIATPLSLPRSLPPVAGRESRFSLSTLPFVHVPFPLPFLPPTLSAHLFCVLLNFWLRNISWNINPIVSTFSQ